MPTPIARCAVLLLPITFCAGLPAQTARAGDGATAVAIVRANWEAWEVARPTSNAIDKARALADSQQPDGCWADVDYSDQRVSEWRAGMHLDRLNALATSAYVLRDHHAANPILDEAAVHALRCWLKKDPHNPNWWWNEIGAPRIIGRAALLLQPQLSADDVALVTRILQRSIWTSWTGQNLVWGVDIQLMRGLLDGDDALVRQAFDRMYAEVRIAPLWQASGKPGEGIEADGSFHQHGAQLYSGGYGLGFATDVGRALVLSWATPFQAPPEVLNAYSHFLLDGEQWMMHTGVFDYVARGREITRKGETKATYSNEFVRVVQALALLPLPRQPEFQSFGASLNSNGESKEVSGNRGFWDSDLIEHKRPGYSTSVRMLSARSKNEESLNGEGMRSVHLADGVNLLYKNGQEYAGIFPVWDWNLIPGTTAMQWTDSKGVPVTGEKQSIGQMGQSEFAGEVSNGKYGAAAMVLERGPLTAKKAWFFFDHLYVALGASIHVADAAGIPAVPVVTTVEQSRMQGTVLQKQRPDGRLLVAHNGIGYIVGTDAKPNVRNVEQSGRWSDIGTGSSTLVSIPIFRLTLDHGVRPINGRYQYIVLPEGGMEAAQAEAASPTVKVLANRDDVQAVSTVDRTMVMAVFYQAGVLETPIGTLRVNAPALVLLHHDQGPVSVTASNPLGGALDLGVTLNGFATTLPLPGGMDGGRSVTRTIIH